MKSARASVEVRPRRIEVPAGPAVLKGARHEATREGIRRFWADPEKRRHWTEAQRRALADPKVRKRKSAGIRRAWADPEKRKHRIEAMRRAAKDPEQRKRKSAGLRRAWADPEKRKHWIEVQRRALADPKVRKRKSEGHRRAWTDAEKRKRMTEGIRRARLEESALAREARAARGGSLRRNPIVALAPTNGAAEPKRRGGRPRKDAIRLRVQQSRNEGVSWGKIGMKMNKETGHSLTANAYRNLLSR